MSIYDVTECNATFIPVAYIQNNKKCKSFLLLKQLMSSEAAYDYLDSNMMCVCV